MKNADDARRTSTPDRPSTPVSFDPFALDYLAAPFETLARIREASPAFYVEQHRFFLVTRHADVVAASKAHEIFSSTGGVGIEWKSRPMMPMYDPPEHTKLRRIVAPFFTPRAVATYERAVRSAVVDVLTRALEDGATDTVKNIAEPISLRTLAEILGVPPERQADLRRWADNTMIDLAGGAPASELERIETVRREFVQYLRQLVAERRRSLGTDLISVLLRANDAEALADREVVGFCVLLLVAGFEPSASAIANLCRALVIHVPDLDALPSDREGQAAVVEELLRWDSPVQAFFRNTLVDASIGGVEIPKDSKVMIHFGAANRDPALFSEPDEFKLDRSPNAHIGFGAGIHYCLGAPLARLQLGTFLEELRSRVRSMREEEPETRQDNLLFRGLSHHRVRFSSR